MCHSAIAQNDRLQPRQEPIPGARQAAYSRPGQYLQGGRDILMRRRPTDSLIRKGRLVNREV